jgi:hypothetical protein
MMMSHQYSPENATGYEAVTYYMRGSDVRVS